MEVGNSGSDQAEVTSTSKIQTHRKLGKLVAQPMCSPRHSSRIRAPRHARSRCRSRQWSRERPQSACGITQCWHHCKTPWKEMLDYHLSKVWSAFTCVTMTMLQMFTPLASLTWGSRPKRTRGTFRNWNTESKLVAQPKVTVSKSAHTALAVKACLLGGNSNTKCSMTFVNIAVAISALAGGGAKNGFAPRSVPKKKFAPRPASGGVFDFFRGFFDFVRGFLGVWAQEGIEMEFWVILVAFRQWKDGQKWKKHCT